MNPLTNILARRADQPILNYVWKAVIVALIPSLIIGTLVSLVVPDKGPQFKGPLFLVVFSVLVISPWLETLLMWPILWILKRFLRTQTRVAIGSALVWGLFHSLLAPAWGLTVAWPFFVFSYCFLEWEKKSKIHAILATALVHTGQNLLPAIVIAFTLE
jgi:hypothetical protein